MATEVSLEENNKLRQFLGLKPFVDNAGAQVNLQRITKRSAEANWREKSG